MTGSWVVGVPAARVSRGGTPSHHLWPEFLGERGHSVRRRTEKLFVRLPLGVAAGLCRCRVADVRTRCRRRDGPAATSGGVPLFYGVKGGGGVRPVGVVSLSPRKGAAEPRTAKSPDPRPSSGAIAERRRGRRQRIRKMTWQNQDPPKPPRFRPRPTP